MSASFKMPERTARDGQISVSRDEEDGSICMTAEDEGRFSSMRVSEYNATRIFGCLALMLGIDLPAKLAKAIKLGDKPIPMTFGRGDRSKMSLGERIAANLADKATIEALRKAGYEVDAVPAPRTVAVNSFGDTVTVSGYDPGPTQSSSTESKR